MHGLHQRPRFGQRPMSATARGSRAGESAPCPLCAHAEEFYYLGEPPYLRHRLHSVQLLAAPYTRWMSGNLHAWALSHWGWRDRRRSTKGLERIHARPAPGLFEHPDRCRH
jgi:hypothetical protein